MGEREDSSGREREGGLPSIPFTVAVSSAKLAAGMALLWATLAAWIPFCRGGPLTISTAPRGASRITEMDGRMGKLVSGWGKIKIQYSTKSLRDTKFWLLLAEGVNSRKLVLDLR